MTSYYRPSPPPPRSSLPLWVKLCPIVAVAALQVALVGYISSSIGSRDSIEEPNFPDSTAAKAPAVLPTDVQRAESTAGTHVESSDVPSSRETLVASTPASEASTSSFGVLLAVSPQDHAPSSEAVELTTETIAKSARGTNPTPPPSATLATAPLVDDTPVDDATIDTVTIIATPTLPPGEPPVSLASAGAVPTTAASTTAPASSEATTQPSTEPPTTAAPTSSAVPSSSTDVPPTSSTVAPTTPTTVAPTTPTTVDGGGKDDKDGKGKGGRGGGGGPG